LRLLPILALKWKRSESYDYNRNKNRFASGTKPGMGNFHDRNDGGSDNNCADSLMPLWLYPGGPRFSVPARPCFEAHCLRPFGTWIRLSFPTFAISGHCHPKRGCPKMGRLSITHTRNAAQVLW